MGVPPRSGVERKREHVGLWREDIRINGEAEARRERHGGGEGVGRGGGGGRVGASTKEGARTAYELRDEQQPATQTGFESYLYATRLPISGLTST